MLKFLEDIKEYVSQMREDKGCEFILVAHHHQIIGLNLSATDIVGGESNKAFKTKIAGFGLSATELAEGESNKAFKAKACIRFLLCGPEHKLQKAFKAKACIRFLLQDPERKIKRSRGIAV
jgi:hypothetical protein